MAPYINEERQSLLSHTYFMRKVYKESKLDPIEITNVLFSSSSFFVCFLFVNSFCFDSLRWNFGPESCLVKPMSVFPVS